MECLLASVLSSPASMAPFSAPKQKRHRCRELRAKLSSENDPWFESAVSAASLRFQETNRAEPLLVDPFAGCFVDPDMHMVLKKHPHPYCVAAKFIDDKLLQNVHSIDGLKQVVLLTDGMCTRPYRLNWPTSTMIFDISPERVSNISSHKLRGVGAKTSRRCFHVHVPMESPDFEKALRARGFKANTHSIWALQGIPITTLASFEQILFTISCLATKGTLFLGELPAWLAETDIGSQPSAEKWINKLFMGNGFKVDSINYDEVANSLGKEIAPESHSNILFVAEQLRFSDDQMETWRREFQRVEEGADEEGFEEL
ncbi:unnamed protein product [Linum tenue]|uniref:S-adenosyl-L-methionine-dependent methyltransferase n=1 Tax=Linum tenue TaxID=586396 RepID=A0AAV0PF91_9ROSI|nr:unnamed protein product [Linum tenue]